MANRFLNNITINDEYTLPSVDGTTGQAITTDGAGNLSFSTVDSDSALKITLRVKNVSGGTLNAGTLVRVAPTASPPSGNVLEVDVADNSSASTMPAVGILISQITDGSEGDVVAFGRAAGFSTSGYTEGDPIWVGSNGAFVGTKPTGSDLIQKVGQIIKVHSSNGSIEVFGAGRTNDVPNLPSGKIWVGDGNTVTSTVVHLDETNNRLGINNITPSVSVDINATDAIKIPAGTEAQRPTPTSGMIRFNTTSDEFEGYNGTEWAPIGGTGSAGIDIDNFTGDDNEVNFTLTSEIQEEDNTQVYIDGVYQSKSNYTTSGTTLTFSTPPPTGTSIEVVNFTSIAESQIDGTGTANYVSKWTDADTLANSVIQDDGTTVTIGNNTIVNGDLTVDTDTLYVDSSNNRVGIGTTSPSVEVEIASAAPQIRLTDTDGGYCEVTNVSGHLLLQADKGNTQLSSYMRFDVDGSERMRIDSSGNVSLSTAASLDFNVSDYAEIRFKESAGIVIDSDNNQSSRNFQIKDGSGSSLMTILDTGNVGIGTTAPSSKLSVNGGDLQVESGQGRFKGWYTAGSGLGLETGVSGGTGYIVSYDRTALTYASTIIESTGVQFATSAAGKFYFIGGNVGIGTASPTNLLTLEETDTNSVQLLIDNFNTSDAGTETSTIRFRHYRSYVAGLNDAAEITVGKEEVWDASGDRNSYMSFATRNGSVGVTERLRIDSNGVVSTKKLSGGGSMLDLRGSTYSDIQYAGGLSISSNTSNNYNRYWNIDASFGLSIGRYVTSTDALDFNALTISSSGNVGIGTTSPAAKLDVVGQIKASSGFTTDNVAKTYSWRGANTGNSGTIWKHIATLNLIGHSTRIKITATGDTSYSAGLNTGHLTILAQVNNNNELEGTWFTEGGTNSSYNDVYIVNNGSYSYSVYIKTGGYGEYAFEAVISQGQLSNHWTTVSTPTGGAFLTKQWHVNQQLYINSSDNVGIGTNSPSAKLEITAPNLNTFLSNITSTTSANIHQIKNDNSKGIETVIYSSAYSGGTYLSVGANGSAITSNSKTAITTVGAFDLLLGTNSTERMRILSSGGITFNGDTATANALDDYEEGTFTPTAYGDTTTGTTTYTYQNGNYTKIGRQVTVNLAIGWSALTGTGRLRIGGLPFTGANVLQNYSQGSILVDGLNWSGGTFLTPIQILNANFMEIYGLTDNGNAASQTCVNEAVFARITITYFAA